VTKVGFNEPNILNEKLFEHQIKITTGITELYKSSDHSEIYVYYLDVDLMQPSVVVIANGLTVRQLNALHELGLKRRKPVLFLSEL